MARQLYDYWFVQFDFPDENGRPYKSSGGKMVWNEKLKRKIPEGWYAALMKDFLVIGNGKDHKDLETGIYPVYGSGGLMRYVNDFLFSGESVLLPRKGSLSNFMYVNEPFWTVDTMFYTKEKLKGAAKYIYYSMRYVDITRYDSGTGVPSMTSISYYAMPFVKPTNDIIKLFDEILSPWIAQIKRNEVQIKNLTKQRDELLPMLMNGQVSVMPSEVNCDLYLLQLSILLTFDHIVLHNIRTPRQEGESCRGVGWGYLLIEADAGYIGGLDSRGMVGLVLGEGDGEVLYAVGHAECFEEQNELTQFFNEPVLIFGRGDSYEHHHVIGEVVEAMRL